jgi:hypothetical protein
MKILVLGMQILAIYVFARGIWTLPVAWGWKLVAAVLLELGVFDLPVVLFYCHLLPKSLNILFGYACLLLIYLAVVTLVFDIARLCHFPYQHLFLPIVLATAVFAAFVVWRSTWLPTVKQVHLAQAQMPKGYKIVLLTDLQTGPILQRPWVEKVVDKVNALKPNLVVITGDSMDSYTRDGLTHLEPLARLKAPVYMAFGNHEYYYDAQNWRKAFENMGIRVLKNESVVIDNAFVLGGGDWGRGYRDDSGHFVAKTFANAPEGLPKILLSHYPKSFTEAKASNVWLQLSGHTHGGQSYPISWATQLSNQGYLRGLYAEPNAFGTASYLYVSDGTGLWAGMPARFGSTNEITLLTFGE